MHSIFVVMEAGQYKFRTLAHLVFKSTFWFTDSFVLTWPLLEEGKIEGALRAPLEAH